MLKIAICDDDMEVCKIIEDYLNNIMNEFNIKIVTEVYYNGERFNSHLENNYMYDLIFLDIELNNILGLDIGKNLRDNLKCETTFIVYISSKVNYAMSLFKTRPFDFLEKPIKYEVIKRVVLLANNLLSRSKKFFEYKNGKNTYKILFNDIIFFESSDKKIIIHTLKEELEFYDKLDNIANNIDSIYFFHIHKSYLVNYLYIKQFSYEYIILHDDTKLQISQSRRTEIRNKQLALRMENYEY